MSFSWSKSPSWSIDMVACCALWWCKGGVFIHVHVHVCMYVCMYVCMEGLCSSFGSAALQGGLEESLETGSKTLEPGPDMGMVTDGIKGVPIECEGVVSVYGRAGVGPL